MRRLFRDSSITQRQIVAGVGVVLFVVLMIWSVQVGRAGLSLYTHLQDAQAAAESPSTADPAALCATVRGMRADVDRLQSRAGFLVQLAPAFGWLPRIGGDLRAAPHLLTVADGLTDAGALGCDAMAPALDAFGSDADISPQDIVQLLAANQADLERALADVKRARAGWDAVDPSTLSPRIASRADLLERGLPLLEDGLQASLVAPGLAGADAPRTYLILAQNNDELRATGGFITAAGIVQVENGEIAELTFNDSYAVDDFSKPYPTPPYPIEQYMLADLWVFRDSNWSADFPTAAQQAASLYELGTGQTPDGVIALDMHALQSIVGAVGPLTVAEASGLISGDNFIQWIREARGGRATDEDVGEWYRERKDFLKPLAEALKARIEQGNVDWPALLRAVMQNLETKHILIHLDEPAINEMLTEQGWNGAIQPASGDYLYVVDSNLGFNKVNPSINESIGYTVTIDGNGSATGNLAIRYNNRSRTDGSECDPSPHYGDRYIDETHRCYWDYLRVYVPAESELRSATPAPLPDASLLNTKRGGAGEETLRTATSEHGMRVFAVYFLVPRGATRTQQFEYALPDDLIQEDGTQSVYSLQLQKQPGTGSRSVTVTVQLPADVTLTDATPAPAEHAGSTVTFTLHLDSDQTIQLKYNPES